MNKYAEVANVLQQIDARNGLPEEIFLAISTLIPISNVDLLILNKNKQLLLSYRKDSYFGEGWHFPGGCLRFMETMEERIQKTALEEIGTNVVFDPKPIVVKDVIVRNYRKDLENQKLRAHHLTHLFRCYLPDDFKLNNYNLCEKDNGFLKWFEFIPYNLLKVHNCYLDLLKSYLKG